MTSVSMVSAAVEEVPPIMRSERVLEEWRMKIQLVFSEEISDNVGQKKMMKEMADLVALLGAGPSVGEDEELLVLNSA